MTAARAGNDTATFRRWLCYGCGYVLGMGGCIAGALAGGLLVSWAKGGFDRVELFLGGRLGEATLVELLTIVVGGAAGLAVGIGAWVALARRSGSVAEAELLKVSGRN